MMGRLIKGSGGLRKVRWATDGRGKRGALRIIYYWEPSRSTFYCLYVSPTQVRVLCQLVEEEFG
jgi:mRNA-degrading endonuclease RelE of RelBE toxin-antitoxin system